MTFASLPTNCTNKPLLDSRNIGLENSTGGRFSCPFFVPGKVFLADSAIWRSRADFQTLQYPVIVDVF